MLIIRGDKRVADIYFGEFMRVFDLDYTRYIVRILADDNRSDPEMGYLKEETAADYDIRFQIKYSKPGFEANKIFHRVPI